MRGPRHFRFITDTHDKTSMDYGIIVNKIPRPILPELRSRKMTIPGMDGAWDFGGNTYNERIIPIHCTIKDPLDNISTIEEIAAWLSKKGKLILSDTPYKYYTGRVYSPFSEEIEQTTPIGTFVLEFIVDSFPVSITETTDEILLGADIPLGSDITLGNADQYIFTIAEPTMISIDNFGARDIRPTMVINGSFDSITLTVNGKNLIYDHAINNQELVILGHDYDVELDGISGLSELSGDIDYFLTLKPGNNDVEVTGENLNCTIRFKFNPIFY